MDMHEDARVAQDHNHEGCAAAQQKRHAYEPSPHWDKKKSQDHSHEVCAAEQQERHAYEPTPHWDKKILCMTLSKDY